jgi:hypothetical protein
MSAAPSWLDGINPPAGSTTETQGGTSGTGSPEAASESPVASNLGDALAPPESSAPSSEGDKGKPNEAKPDAKLETKAGDKPADETSDETGYAPFKLPEGMLITPEHQSTLTEFGTTHKLPQEAVQQVVDLGVAVAQQTREAIEAADADAMKEMHAEWRKEIQADSELGGAKFAQTQANLNLFQKSSLADDKLIEFLSVSNLIQNPHIVRLLSRVGATYKENAPGMSGSGPGQERNPAKELYAKSKHN